MSVRDDIEEIMKICHDAGYSTFTVGHAIHGGEMSFLDEAARNWAATEMELQARIRELEAQVENLKQELEWEQEAHAKTAQYYGESNAGEDI